MSNIVNQKSCINFIWCINAEKFGTMEKIIAGKDLEIEDIIPNFTTSDHDYYYAQNIASWAINYPENIVRLVYYPVYMHQKVHIGDKQYQDHKEEIDGNINHVSNLVKDLRNVPKIEIPVIIRKRYEQKLQTKYNTLLTLDEIEQKYIDAFLKFKQKMYDHGYRNFQTISYKDLAKNLSMEEIQENAYLNEILNHQIISIANILDYIKTSMNYFGFGYEKNLTIDMDLTPLSMRESARVEFAETDIKFGHRPEQIQAIYSDHTKDQYFLKPIMEVVNKRYPHSIMLQIKDSYYYKKLNHSLTYDTFSEYFLDHVETILPKYYMHNIIRMGNSHIVNIKQEAEPIVFQTNYWPQRNNIVGDGYVLDLDNNIWAGLTLILIFLPFMILIRYRLMTFFEEFCYMRKIEIKINE